MIEKLPPISKYAEESQGNLERMDAMLWVDTRNKIHEIIDVVNRLDKEFKELSGYIISPEEKDRLNQLK